jgi:hypothetical protein
MARTVTQGERVEGERSQTGGIPQFSAPVVERYYRLQPGDLGGLHARPRAATIRFVGTQGIERPAPVLHFEGMAKPLVLDGANVTAIVRIAGSALQRDWLRQRVMLGVVVEGNTHIIRLFALDDPALSALRRKSAQVERVRVRSQFLRQLLRAALVFGALLAAAAAAVYIIENWTAILAAVLAVVDALRNSS